VALPITVPRLDWSMEEGTFAGWLKHDGDRVNRGENLFILESDKASQEIETFEAGILRIPPGAPKTGDVVKVGQVLGYLTEEGEPLPATGDEVKAVAAAPEKKASPVASPSVRRAARALGVNLTQVAGSGPGGRIGEGDLHQQSTSPLRRTQRSGKPASSPRARRVAAELGVDWSRLQGSGLGGRIRERDVRAAASQRGGQVIPHTNMRRTIASRMLAGVTQAAPVTLTTRIQATNLVNLRQQFKAAPSPDDVVPGYTDIILKLTAVALRRHPLLQAQWREEGLFVPDRVDIAFSVDTDAGLLAPVIRVVDTLTLRQVASCSRELISLARAGQLSAEQMRHATFTVTNVGGLGIDAFTPIILLPQCAVLGIGRIVREPVVVEDRVVPGETLKLSLTFDHRVLDGAPAARFLQTLGGGLENPAAWLVP
jgi:pyruvate dehydrogenase E2 component (dihydrolipoamide acetyltransferase)